MRFPVIETRMYVTPRALYHRTLTSISLSYPPAPTVPGPPSPFPNIKTSSARFDTLMSSFRPLYQTANSQWRALSAGVPVSPTSAFSYITRALRQTAPNVVGALRLLSESFPPKELNEKGFSLYADFRPESEGWGQRGEVRCSTILSLRKVSGESAESDGQSATVGGAASSAVDSIVQLGPPGGSGKVAPHASEEQPSKKPKQEASEPDEYDAALDDDAPFGEFDLSSIP